MTWNIQNTSTNKLNFPGFTTAVARTAAAANVDILLIVEIMAGTAQHAMKALSQELNTQERAVNPRAGAHCWHGYSLTPPTGTERYCAMVRNLDMIRPVRPDGQQYIDHLTDVMGDVEFVAWSSARRNPLPAAGPVARPVSPPGCPAHLRCELLIALRTGERVRSPFDVLTGDFASLSRVTSRDEGMEVGRLLDSAPGVKE
ncbi:MAG TPA: hypothetical protein VK545_16385 [Streptomyces sp.]|nr:hypothetical protein [Streptomyces sp.]